MKLLEGVVLSSAVVLDIVLGPLDILKVLVLSTAFLLCLVSVSDKEDSEFYLKTAQDDLFVHQHCDWMSDFLLHMQPTIT